MIEYHSEQELKIIENYDKIQRSAVDDRIFAERLDEFLPKYIFDTHVHVWKLEHKGEPRFLQRGEDWAEKIEFQNSVEAYKTDTAALFPGHNLTGLLFGWISTNIVVTENNRYVGNAVRENPGFAGLAVSCPFWSREETILQIEGNGLIGMKPYVTFASKDIDTKDITIFDILSKEQLKLADERKLICMLHLPRPGRLPDPANIRQLLEIEYMYPNARIIVAHIGRCYSEQDLGNAFELLKETKNMCFDFSGNTNAVVIRKAVETFGDERVLYGSDLPLSHFHLKRIYNEKGHYINLINGSERPQINNASYMQVMPDADTYTYFLYESINAMRQAADDLGLSRKQIENIFYNNAQRLIRR